MLRAAEPSFRWVDASKVPAADAILNPSFEIEGRSLVLHPLQIVSVAAGSLGALVGSLSEEGDRIIASLDLLLSRAWE